MTPFLRTMLTSAVITLLITSHAYATNLNISNVPLYLGGSIPPNIIFTLDDSGSMQFEMMPDDNWTRYIFPVPDEVYGSSTYANRAPAFEDTSYSVRTRSSHINKIYYNPQVTYQPWSDYLGNSMGNVTPSCAPHNPSRPGLGCRNLTSTNREYADWESFNGDADDFPDDVSSDRETRNFWPAVYYHYNGGDEWDASNYTEVEIRSGSTYAGGPNRLDCGEDSPETCSYNEEIQNFANWYSYYRSRVLVARAGVGLAFGAQDASLRVGFAKINQGDARIDGVESERAMVRGIRGFAEDDREQFFDLLYGTDIPALGTPLRRAVESVAEYFKRSDSRGPWSATPGSNSDDRQLTCRQNYQILMTDGYWNGSDPDVGNSDNAGGAEYTSSEGETFQYSPAAPYADSWSDTLADVAMEYWKTDLRPDMINDVPTNSSDPAFWQHLVNFTIGLGVNGNLDPTTDWDGLRAGTTDWPEPSDDSIANIDDLWHAAVNSRGTYFNVNEPTEFADALTNILGSINSRNSSSTSIALNTTSLNADSRIYQATYFSGNWTGELLSYRIDANGNTLENGAWNAAEELPAFDARNIFTFDGTEGKSFLWDEISVQQQGQIGSENVLDFLRGDTSMEEGSPDGGPFRSRETLLGDIINSNPVYYGPPAQRYLDNWGTGAAENDAPYSAYVSAYNDRQPVVYVGANDGMLHAFNADNGEELFAYVPAAVYHNLNLLSQPGYNHRFFVDDTPTVVDAFIGDSWRTVLVSGLRSGGQAIFALDVTDPTNFSEEDVLWEFSDVAEAAADANSNSSDLGYTFGTPSVVRLQNGVWAAVFSGGYNNTIDNASDGAAADSTTGDAALYIVNLADGSLIKKINTGVGAEDDPSGENRPNGLSSPAVIDVDNDNIADLIYAGDLFGNMWKFDVAGSPGDWASVLAYDDGSPEPLFQACSGEDITPVDDSIVIPPSITPAEPGTWEDSGRDVRTRDNETSVELSPDDGERVDTNSAEFTLNAECNVSLNIDFDDARNGDRIEVDLQDGEHYAEVRRTNNDWVLQAGNSQNATWDEASGTLTFLNVAAGTHTMNVAAEADNDSDDFEATFSNLFAACLGADGGADGGTDFTWNDSGSDVNVTDDDETLTMTPDEGERRTTTSDLFTITSECNLALSVNLNGGDNNNSYFSVSIDNDNFATFRFRNGGWELWNDSNRTQGATWDNGTLTFTDLTPGNYTITLTALAQREYDGDSSDFSVVVRGGITSCADDDDGGGPGGGDPDAGDDGVQRCDAYNRQAVTTQPQIARHPTGVGYMVLFGTGKYFEIGDNSSENQATQAFYGLWDKASGDPVDPDALLDQQIIAETTVADFEVRVTTDNGIDWSQNEGWKINLIDPDLNLNEGERQVSNAVIRNGRIIFTTVLPSEDQCDFGGGGWLMELDAFSGSRLPYTPFDLNNDDAFTIEDYAEIAIDLDGDGEPETVKVPTSGKKSEVGIINTPAVATTEDGQREIKYTSGSSGDIEITTENPGPGTLGRQSWRYLDRLFRR